MKILSNIYITVDRGQNTLADGLINLLDGRGSMRERSLAIQLIELVIAAFPPDSGARGAHGLGGADVGTL